MEHNEKKSKILIVDDTPENIDILGKILSEYKRVFARSGAKALEKAGSIPPPDLILLDIMMPEMDGYEVCRRLKDNPATKDIPVVFITALSEAEDEAKGIELGAVDYIAKPFSPYVVRARVRSILNLKEKAEQLANMSVKLSKYLSPQVCELILSGQRDVKIESQRKKLTVFFSDIAHFTSTTETMEPEDLTDLLNTYLDAMADIAIKHGGTIDKFVGDAVMVFFGDPHTRGVKEDALACVSMAIDMMAQLKVLQENWRQKGILQPFNIRVGVNTGFCTVGNFGSKSKMDYTIIGTQVNTAKRLEESAMQDQIIISHETWSCIKDQIYCIKKSPIMVKGISRPVQTYQVIGYFNQLDRDGKDVAIGNFAVPVEAVPPETLIRDINVGRRSEDSFTPIVVVQNQSPVGLLMSCNLNRLLNSQSNRAQFFDQPVKTVMDMSPLIFESYVPISEVIQHAMARDSKRMYDPVIVTEKGELKGIVPFYALVEKLMEK